MNFHDNSIQNYWINPHAVHYFEFGMLWNCTAGLPNIKLRNIWVKWSSKNNKEYRPSNLPKNKGKLVIISNPKGKHRRCQLNGCGKSTIYNIVLKMIMTIIKYWNISNLEYWIYVSLSSLYANTKALYIYKHSGDAPVSCINEKIVS